MFTGQEVKACLSHLCAKALCIAEKLRPQAVAIAYQFQCFQGRPKQSRGQRVREQIGPGTVA